jgi:ribose 5-phosphate isomerase B
LKIAVGSDHNGYEMKEQIKAFLAGIGHEVVDYGCHSKDAVDYPGVAFTIAEAISQGKQERGVIVCGTGLGVAIAANKYPGIRAATVHDTYTAERAQLSNNAQIITLGAQVIGIETAKKAVEAFVSVTFDPNSRSAPKVSQIIEQENEFLKKGAAAADASGSCA